jgi:MFS family permease
VVWRLCAATTLIVAAFAMCNPVLAVVLEQAGHSPSAIGLFAMLPFLMVGVLMPVMPRVLARFGEVRTYRWGAALEFAGTLGYALTDGLLWWSLSSIASGAGGAAIWNANEALLARHAPPDRRGRVMGLYQTALGAALAVGPFVPAVFGLEARPVLWSAAAAVAVCCVIAWATPLKGRHEPSGPESHGIWHALRLVPWLAAIAFAGGVFEAGLSSISAAYASSTGLALSAAASVAGAIGTGSFLCQYPAGWAADHFRLAVVFRAAAILLLGASLALLAVPQAPWLLWVVGAVWGGVGGSLYTLTMVHVAHRFAGQATAAGAAAMIAGYTWGGSAGPVASGAALQWLGVGGLVALLAALSLVTLTASRRVS